MVQVRWVIAAVQTRSYSGEEMSPSWPRMIPFSDLNNNAFASVDQNLEYKARTLLVLS